MTLSTMLSKLGLNPSSSELPQSSYAAAEKLLLDTLGCAIAGHAMPGIPEVRDQVVDWGGKGEAGVWLSGVKAPLPQAVFANGAMIHALDYDDVFVPGTLHLTSTIVPVVLGVAEMTNASGEDTLAALTMGVEIAGQLGIAERQRRRGQHFLPSSMLNGFGAVISAARLLDLSEADCVNAMGLNYAQASGNRQALIDMTLTKRLQPAFAARSAMWAVALAKRGITGPGRVFEGEYGYCNSYLNGNAFPHEEFRT